MMDETMTAAPGESMYDRLKNAVYNPWFQMGMGMLGGNSGATRAEARANAFSGGLRGAQGAQQYRYQEAENARQEAEAKRKQAEFDNAMESEKAFKKFATSMLEKNPGSVFWESSVINPKWGMEYFKAQSEDQYRKMQAAASMTGANASMMNAITNRNEANDPSGGLDKKLNWFANLPEDKKQAMERMQNMGKQSTPRAPTSATKEFKSSMDGMWESDPGLAGPRGDGWSNFQSGDWTQKKEIASEITWSLVHQYGMDPVAAAQVAKERVWGQQAPAGGTPKGREGYSAVPKGK